MSEVRRLQIVRLGAQGDGVAETSEGPVHVAFALPGEAVSAEVTGERGRLVAVETASADRVAPPCRHFGECGGCKLQHLAPAVYRDWKRAQIDTAFAMRGLDVASAPLIEGGLGQRRRATLAALRTGRGVILGFHREGTHDIIDLEECPILRADMVAALPALRRLVEPMLSRRGEARVTVTGVERGLDVAIAREDAPELDQDARAKLAQLAAVAGVLRLSIGEEPVFASAEPCVRLGPAEVNVPTSVFLQASAQAEESLAQLVMAAVPKKPRRIADLFCGAGTFTFRLAQRAGVLAVDGDKTAMTALQQAARRTSGLKPIEAKVRDLFREPLARKELDGVDVVVLDPPRAGAKAQCEMLVKAEAGCVVLVSCNPATLARDARVLVDGGFEIESVTGVDQFVYSPHIEAVAVLRRGKRKSRA